jgi:tRNA (cmo5U34)-methyltransferase
MEYGAGTGILSFILSDNFSEITLMDNSQEMVSVMHEKVANGNIKNLKPLLFDLEKTDYEGQKFDCIFSQMVLHHVSNTEQLLQKFYQMLHPGGFLVIADLYAEDGSFHGEGFTGHNGFNVDYLQNSLEKTGFDKIKSEQCYILKKAVDTVLYEFPIFLLVATK